MAEVVAEGLAVCLFALAALRRYPDLHKLADRLVTAEMQTL